jgi:hypothetical protein
MRGMDWVFKQSSLRFIFKGITIFKTSVLQADITNTAEKYQLILHQGLSSYKPNVTLPNLTL